MALTQNFHVISVLKRHKETFHGTNLELSCGICVEETQRDCSWYTSPELSCNICVEETQRDCLSH